METARLLVRREVVMNGVEHYRCLRRPSRKTFVENRLNFGKPLAIHELGFSRRSAVEVARVS
jgi:hypothetical protein